MTNKNIKHVLAVSISLGLAAPATVFATNGMFLIANGTKSNGMGGVSIAMTHDTLTSASNPATMAFTGNRFDIGGDIFIPAATSSVGEGANQLTVESKPKHAAIAEGVYMMPNLGASWSDGDISYGFTMVPVGGGGSLYDQNFYNYIAGRPGVDDDLGVSLMVMNINPTIAMKLDDTHTVGATLIIGMQVFKAFGLSEFLQFTSTQDAEASKFTDEGTEVTYGAGVRLGWLGKFLNNDLTLGAEYTSQTYMKAFDKYKDLFAEQGKINTPGNIGIGAAYQFNSDLLLAMDITYIMYEDVNAIANIGPNVSGEPLPVDRETNALGEAGGLGFGWVNQTVYEVGAQYSLNETWTLRGGWNYGKSPINEAREVMFNIVAPATTEHHLTLGATMRYSKDIELSFSYIHAFANKQYGPIFLGESTGSIEMEQNSLGATFSMNF